MMLQYLNIHYHQQQHPLSPNRRMVRHPSSSSSSSSCSLAPQQLQRKQCRFGRATFVTILTLLMILPLQYARTTSHDSISSITQSIQRQQYNILPSEQQQQQLLPPYYQPARISLLHKYMNRLQNVDDDITVKNSATAIRTRRPTQSTKSFVLLLQKMRGGESDTAVSSEATATTSTNDDATNPSSSSSSVAPIHTTIQPVTIIVQTNTGSSIIDPMIELPLVNPNKRTILSIKQSIQRQLASSSSSSSKPPISAIQLIYQGQILTNDELLLADVIDEDDDDDDESDDNGMNTKSNDGKQIQMYLDMIPPVVDTKNFIYDIESKLEDLTTSELLMAYTTNEASMYYNTLRQVESLRTSHNDEEDRDDDNENHDEINQSKSSTSSSSSSSSSLISVQIRERAQQIRQDMIETILHSSQSRKLLIDTETPKQKLLRDTTSTMNDVAVEIRGERIRHIGISGIRGNYIRLLQHELNIEDWYRAMKHCLLFLFFGYFGGRTTVSRTILLLGAPLMILIQTRFMKLYIRQLLYAVLYNPPSIVLSLLPAPQQAILSLNLSDAMKHIYGKYIVIDELTNQLLKDDPSINDHDTKSNDLSEVLTSKRFTAKATTTKDDEVDDAEEEEEEDFDADDEEDNDDGEEDEEEENE